jgi:hypothetical protein
LASSTFPNAPWVIVAIAAITTIAASEVPVAVRSS